MNNAGVFTGGENALSYEKYDQGFGVDVMYKKKKKYLNLLPDIKLATSTGSTKKQESSRKTSTSALLTTPKPLTVWITTVENS